MNNKILFSLLLFVALISAYFLSGPKTVNASCNAQQCTNDDYSFYSSLSATPNANYTSLNVSGSITGGRGVFEDTICAAGGYYYYYPAQDPSANGWAIGGTSLSGSYGLTKTSSGQQGPGGDPQCPALLGPPYFDYATYSINSFSVDISSLPNGNYTLTFDMYGGCYYNDPLPCPGAEEPGSVGFTISRPVDVSGSCGGTLNTCTAGSFSDTADDACVSKWDCVGTGSGSTAHCTLNKANGSSCTTGGGLYGTCTSGSCACTAGSISGSSPSSAVSGSAVTVTCSGPVSDSISVSSSGLTNCNYSGGTYSFGCTAGSAGGPYPVTCNLGNSSSYPYCPTSGSAGSITVTCAGTAPACGDSLCHGTATCVSGSWVCGSYPSSATPCRASAGACDIAETCDGAGSCPVDAHQASSYVCNAAGANPTCDPADTCGASTTTCPANVTPANSTTCSGASCSAPNGYNITYTYAALCDGAGNCPAASTRNCGGNACSAYSCAPNGTSNGCSQASLAAGSQPTGCNGAKACNGIDVCVDCGASGEICCGGSGGSCSSGSTCDSGGTCDQNGSCGTAAQTYPSSASAFSGSFCATGTASPSSPAWPAAGSSVSWSCLGTTPGGTNASCSATHSAVSGVCTPNATQPCGSQADACSTGSQTCAPDGLSWGACVYPSSATVCRGSTGVCDPAETCPGTGAVCPANSLSSAGTVCTAATQCTNAATCTGSSASCPAATNVANGTTCNDGNGATCSDVCTNGSCAGSSCPCTFSISPPSANVASSAGSGSFSVNTSGGCAWTASSNDGWLTITAGSSGSGNGTVSYSYTLNGGSARSGSISVTGSNTFTLNQAGTASVCTPNATRPCGGQTDVCSTGSQTCASDGSAWGTCTYPSSSTVCRGSTGVCDPAETCPGTGAVCPADSLSSAGTVCTSATQCTNAATCTGSSASCPAATNVGNGTTCNDGNGATCNDVCTNGACGGSSCGAGPALSLAPLSFTFNATAGAGAPAGQTITITNSGTAGSQLGVYGQTNTSWCRIGGYNNTGLDSLIINQGNPANISITVDATTTPGTYNCTIHFADNGLSFPTDPAANVPQDVSVTYNVVAPPPGPTGVSADNTISCGKVTTRWNSLGGATGYKVYRNTSNDFATSTNISGLLGSGVTSYIDTTGTSGQLYSYWVTAIVGGVESSASAASNNQVAPNFCAGDLSASIKNITAIDGVDRSPVPGQCNGFVPLSDSTTLKLGQIITFRIDLCNGSNGTSSNISIIDSLINMKQPPGAGGFNFCLNASGANCSSGTVITEGAGNNHYQITGTSPYQTITINLSNMTLGPNGGGKITFTAQLDLPANYTGSTRFSNSYTINYSNGNGAATPVRKTTPYIPFVKDQSSSVLKEVQ